jgi:dienelactone hydrolase
MTAAVLALGVFLQEPGKVETLECKADPAQKYVCYLPKAYTPLRKWPILYCFSPNADGASFVRLYKDVAEEVGWIVAASNNSRNGPWEPIQAAISALWADTHARFSLDDKRVFASGFSGGARVSFAMSKLYPEAFAGVLAIGAGLDDGKPPGKGVAVWLVCGETDFNLKELEALDARLKSGGYRYARKTFPGGHTLPPPELAAESVRWMAREKPPRVKPNPSKAKESFEAGVKALEAKSYKKAIAAFGAAAQLGDDAILSDSRAKLEEIQSKAEELWKEAEAATDKSKKRSLLTKLKTDFEGLEIAARAAEALKKLK